MAVFVLGLLLGVRLLTSSAETAAPAPTCTDRTIAAGDKLTTNLVTINVYNASTRSGLANRVQINLLRKGFLAGSLGNSTSAAKPKAVAILTDDKKDPQVRLVAAQFDDKVTYAKPDVEVDRGVTIVVGDDYSSLKKKAAREVKLDRPVTVCVPTVEVP